MKSIVKVTVVSLISLFVWAAKDYNRNVSEYNLTSTGVGLVDNVSGKNYDPVSYFPEGGSSPKVGKSELSVMHEGVEYFFSNAANKSQFLSNPKKYEPTYGGWCARAMAAGGKVAIDTKLYIINGNRIHFFVNNRALRGFQRDLDNLEKLADQNWKDISGESPRL